MNEPAKPQSAFRQVGGTMFSLCLVLLLIARAVTRTFFPELRAHGLTPGMLLLMIPIWSIGVIGALLWLVGCLRGRT
jgi:hypothetical protein